MIETGFGRVLAVEQRPLGSALDGDHASGTTTILVEDCADFDDTYGGQLVIAATTYTYAEVDDEASTITIDPALEADVEDTTGVLLLDPLTGVTATEWIAQVTVDGIDPGDSLEATIRSSLVDRLPEGLRGITGENVELQWDESGSLWLVDVLGVVVDSRAGVTKFRNIDTMTVAATGTQTFTLTYTPIDGSLQVWWGGVPQPPTEWSLSGNVVTIPDPDGLIEIDDTLEAYYAYDRAALSPLEATYPVPTCAYATLTGDPLRLFEPASETPDGFDRVSFTFPGTFTDGTWKPYIIKPSGLYDLPHGAASYTGPVTDPYNYLHTSTLTDVAGVGIYRQTSATLNPDYASPSKPDARWGLNDPNKCSFYWGLKIADFPDDDVDEPGPLEDA